MSDDKFWVEGKLVRWVIDGIEQPIDGITERVQRSAQSADWPVVLRAFKLLGKPEDRGAGDIIARVIGPIGGDAFKKWYKITFGVDCNCGNRQEVLNQKWPL